MENNQLSPPPGNASGAWNALARSNGQSLGARLRNHLQVILIILVGSVVSVAGAWFTGSQVAAHQAMEFEWVAQDRNRALKKGMEDGLKAVLSLGDLMRLNPHINPEDFRQFSAALRVRYPGLYSLEWLPWVPGNQREGHETAAREQLHDYGISEWDATNTRVPAGPRSEYFPIFLAEPNPSGKPVLGFDRGSDPMQWTLIERAIQSRAMVVSGRIPLDPDTAQYGVMVFIPVFGNPGAGPQTPSGELRGLVVGMLQLAELANHSITLLEPRGVEFLLRDESAPPGEGFLDFYASRLGPEPRLICGAWQGWSLPNAPRVTEVFAVGDRRWSITCAATQHYRSAEGFKEGPWIVLLGGLALTCLAGLLFHSMRTQMQARLRIEAEWREAERRRLETQAIRNARLATLGVLAASVAHEINNPNSAIQFNALLLQKSYADMAPILRREAERGGNFLIGGVPVAQALNGLPKLLDGLMRNAQRIQSIIADLKYMARQDPGEYNQPVDLGKVLQAVYSILQHPIQKCTDHCQLTLPEGLPLIRGNAQQLEQVFLNLVLNALQALPNRTAALWVQAELEPDGGHVRVSVVDQGSGIGEEDQKHLFEPFFTTHPDQGGTGLGLSISQRIIQNHGGAIEINSQPGIGTEVSMRLPVARTA